MTNIYILKLENNKYYVGKTTNPKFRLGQHFDSNGSAWTKKYKPIKVIKLIPNCDSFDEDKWTKKYMSKYGINNVRGGTFCQIKLNTENINTIQKELDGAADKCFNCGESGHFANQCEYIDDIELQKMYEKLYKQLKKEDRCFRCQRTGHYEEDCYAKTYDNGEDISESEDEEEIEVFGCQYCGKEFETQKGATMHENKYCKQKNKRQNITCKNRSNPYHTCNSYCKKENKKIDYEVFGCRYCGKEFETQKGATFHENVYCKQKKSKYNYSKRSYY